jgi:hypothetical protein
MATNTKNDRVERLSMIMGLVDSARRLAMELYTSGLLCEEMTRGFFTYMKDSAEVALACLDEAEKEGDAP